MNSYIEQGLLPSSNKQSKSAVVVRPRNQPLLWLLFGSQGSDSDRSWGICVLNSFHLLVRLTLSIYTEQWRQQFKILLQILVDRLEKAGVSVA